MPDPADDDLVITARQAALDRAFNWPRIARNVALPRSKQASTSGGSRDSDATALAVVPTGEPLESTDVITVTPVAKCPMASRSSAADTSASGPQSAKAMSELSVVRGQ